MIVDKITFEIENNCLSLYRSKTTKMSNPLKNSNLSQRLNESLVSVPTLYTVNWLRVGIFI